MTLSATANIDGVDERVNVDVAVLDTGIDLDHPDLNVDTSRSKSLSCIGGNSPDDKNGHGSHVAGTIGGLDNNFGVVGVAPGAILIAVRVLAPNGGACLSDIAAGVDYVTSLNTDADPDNDVDLINMSLGWQDNAAGRTLHRTAIQGAVDVGIVVVVAAGNESDDVYGADGVFDTDDDRIPAAFPEAAAISALADSDGEAGGNGSNTSWGPDDSFASFSNFSTTVVSGNPVTSAGAAIDLLMPGVDIFSTDKGGSYSTKSGTSMATPHAVGLAGLYIAVNGRDADGDGDSDAADVAAIRQALIDGGMDQASGNRLAHPSTEPDSNPENLGWAGGSVDNPPSVAVTNPADGSTVSGTIDVTADAIDDSGVTQVEFFVDGVSIGVDTTAPYAAAAALLVAAVMPAFADGEGSGSGCGDEGQRGGAGSGSGPGGGGEGSGGGGDELDEECDRGGGGGAP